MTKVEELQQELNISGIHDELGSFTIDDHEDALEVCIAKLRSHVENYADFIEGLIHPDSNLVTMQEATMFTDQGELFALYRELIGIQREYIALRLDAKQEQKKDYFKRLWDVWQSKKIQIKEITATAISVWKADTQVDKDTTRYFG